MALKVSARLRNAVRVRAAHLCEYCRTPEWLIGQTHELDHIHPRVAGGKTTRENLCLACAPCNNSKRAQFEALDLETGVIASLFNPRLATWNEHFEWDMASIRIIGLTACGRATVLALNFNNDRALQARSIWVGAGLFPVG